MSRVATSRNRLIYIVVFAFFGVRVLFGDVIGGFMDGMIIGFTDGI